MNKEKTPVKLFEGSYSYKNAGENYASEFFSVTFDQAVSEFRFQAEVLSRLKTGDHLKIICEFILDGLYNPMLMHVRRSIGPLRSEEVFTQQPASSSFTYKLIDQNQNLHEESIAINGKNFWRPPCACASYLFVQQRQIDFLGRRGYSIFCSPNEWDFSGLPSEQTVYAEFETPQDKPFMIKDKPLDALFCGLYDSDINQVSKEDSRPIIAYLSKYMSIPYNIQDGDTVIEIDKLIKADELEKLPRF